LSPTSLAGVGLWLFDALQGNMKLSSEAFFMTTPASDHDSFSAACDGAPPAPSRHSFQQRLRQWAPALLAYASAVSVSVAAAAALVTADLPTQALIAVI
jgi:hypothetical protein